MFSVGKERLHRERMGLKQEKHWYEMDDIVTLLLPFNMQLCVSIL